jgi:hypothetical protein
MPPHNNTLQTIPPEIRIQIHHTAASLDNNQPKTLTILGSKLLESHRLGEHHGIIPIQFANAATTTLHPLSVTCRQFYSGLPPLVATAPNPLAYRCIVNNFDLEQLAVFRQFADSPMNCSRDFSLRFQFDSGVVASALGLESALDRGINGCFPWNIKQFMLFFSPHHRSGSAKSVVFGVGGGEGGEDGIGNDDKAMTEQQARDTVVILRRVRDALFRREAETVIDITVRFEAMVDMYVGRRPGRSDVWAAEEKPSTFTLPRPPIPCKLLLGG